MLQLLEAIEFATIKHDGQVRKITGEPYICHPIRVAAIAEQYLDDQSKFLYPSYAIIAILHDTLEDTETTYDELASRFGDFTAKSVVELTNPPKEGRNRAEQKAFINDRLKKSQWITKQIKLCDRFDNITSRGPIAPENAKWLAKYASETIDLIGAIGEVNSKLAGSIIIQVNAIIQKLPKGLYESIRNTSSNQNVSG